MKILVTGAAGFIGMHVTLRLLERGDSVIGADNLNDYYDVRLKQARLARLQSHGSFKFAKIDLAYRAAVEDLFARENIQRVVHLAAQAGVRHSLKDPHAYITGNIQGFLNILEGCRQHRIEHLVYASSSSVYGMNGKMPFAVGDNVDHPVSLYAATKKSNELMAHAYSYLHGLPVTGLRFFTVYGPWGRPDMSPFLFTHAIFKGEPIQVFNKGEMQRDFTYIDDVTEGVVRVVDQIATADESFDLQHPDPAASFAPYRIYNIGNHEAVSLMTYIEIIEKAVGKTAVKDFLPMQPGDVPATYADIRELHDAVAFEPRTSLAEGMARYVKWFREYYKV
jgi:UDP-glucuronate 4-epimerase